MRRLGVLLLLLVAVAPTGALACVSGVDPCAEEHHSDEASPGGQSEDEGCPPNCDDCACCAVVRTWTVSPAVVLDGPELRSVPLAAYVPTLPPDAPPREILHIPLAIG